MQLVKLYTCVNASKYVCIRTNPHLPLSTEHASKSWSAE